MFLLIASFLAGVLTSLAPCILPLLPVIVGSSVLQDGDKGSSKKKPYIISASLVVSVLVFTFLLKVSTALVGINPKVWTTLAGVIVILLGIVMFFPTLWVLVSSKIGLESSSNKLLTKAYKKSGLAGTILTGAALGPVFSSCSPVYALVLATVLPINIFLGMVYVLAYALGLGLALLAIALAGRRLTSKLGWAVNPNGKFRKVLAVVLVLTGVLVISGYDKRFQTWTADHIPIATSALEKKLIPKANSHIEIMKDDSTLNVKPYAAPDFRGIVDWINSSPLTLEQLRGKVVLVDFWTYSCINCQRTQPYLNKWYDRYHDDGLVIVGVHAPEFAFEKVPENVRKAVQDDGIKYPVALDNDFATWSAYQNQYWPAKYLIDKDGSVRYVHFGEGDYDGTEKAIQTLLKQNGHAVSDKIDSGKGETQHPAQTPETYLGYERGQRMANSDQLARDQAKQYSQTGDLGPDQWSLSGLWNVGSLQDKVVGKQGVLRIKFSAKEVYLVMDGSGETAVTLRLNGSTVTSTANGGQDVDAAGAVHLDGPRLYKLINLPKFEQGQTLDITLPEGASVNAFTFGG